MKNLYILFLVLIPVLINGQFCDNKTIPKNNYSKLYKTIESFNQPRNYNGNLPIVRLSLNNVSRSDGTGGFSWSNIHNLVDDLNQLYANKVCFTVISEHNIEDDDYFGVPTRSGGSINNDYLDLIQENHSNNAIRIYFVNEGGSGRRATGFLFNQETSDPTVYFSEGLRIHCLLFNLFQHF